MHVINSECKILKMCSSKICVIILFLKVKAMVEGRDRRLELGYKLALELRKKENKQKEDTQPEGTEEDQQA
jgi:hypothetical protein